MQTQDSCENSPLRQAANRYGALAFAKSLVHDQDWFEQLWNKRLVISNKPTLFIWGMKDSVIKPYNLEKFQYGFTNSSTIKLNTCGHFPQEEQPEIVTNGIVNFLSQ